MRARRARRIRSGREQSQRQKIEACASSAAARRARTCTYNEPRLTRSSLSFFAAFVLHFRFNYFSRGLCRFLRRLQRVSARKQSQVYICAFVNASAHTCKQPKLNDRIFSSSPLAYWLILDQWISESRKFEVPSRAACLIKPFSSRAGLICNCNPPGINFAQQRRTSRPRKELAQGTHEFEN